MSLDAIATQPSQQEIKKVLGNTKYFFLDLVSKIKAFVYVLFTKNKNFWDNYDIEYSKNYQNFISDKYKIKKEKIDKLSNLKYMQLMEVSQEDLLKPEIQKLINPPKKEVIKKDKEVIEVKKTKIPFKKIVKVVSIVITSVLICVWKYKTQNNQKLNGQLVPYKAGIDKNTNTQALEFTPVPEGYYEVSNQESIPEQFENFNTKLKVIEVLSAVFTDIGSSIEKYACETNSWLYSKGRQC